MLNTFVGVDIGSQCIKIVVLEHKEKMHLVNAVVTDTPYEALGNYEKQINLKELLRIISEAVPAKLMRSAKVGVNLPASSISALSVFLPLMNQKELSYVAINEAKTRMIPASTGDHIFEILPLGQQTVGTVSKEEALVIRTENQHVQRFIHLFRELNVVPSLITSSCCSLPHIMPKEIWKKEETIVFVDIGASSISISIGRHGKLVFLRNIVYGFNDIVSDISRQLGISEEQTRRAIAEKGVPEVPFDIKDKVAIAEEIMRQKYEEMQNNHDSKEPLVNALELRMLWQPHVERVAQELRRSFVFFKEQSQGKGIELMYFLGGVSQINNFFATLSSQIGGKCYLLSPSAIPHFSKEKEVPDEIMNHSIVMNALSIALDVPVMDKSTVNFLPLDLRQREVIARRRLILLASSLITVALFGLVSLILFISNNSIRDSMRKADFELQRLKRISARLGELEEKEVQTQERISQIEALENKRSDLFVPLKDLPLSVPQEVVVTEINLDTNKIEIKAQTFADYEQAKEIIEEFVKNLGSLQRFRNIKVIPLELEIITPQTIGSNGELRLTLPEKREFSLTAEVAY